MENIKTMQKYRGICFDLDQTLCNTEDFIYSFKGDTIDYKNSAEYQVYKYLEPFLKTITWQVFIEKYEEARKYVKKLLKGTASSHSRYLYIQRTLEILGARFNPNLIYEAHNAYWDYIINNMQLYPGALETLQILKKRHKKIAIFTDLTMDVQNKKLKKLKIEKYIDYLVTAEEAGADKPNESQLNLVLKKTGLNPEDILVIGNNPKTDIEAAVKKNVKSILFDYDKKYYGKETKADYYTNSFEEIQKILGLENFEDFKDEKLVIMDFVGTITEERSLVSTILSEILGREPEDIRGYYEMYKIGELSTDEFWKSFDVDDYKRYEDEIVKRLGLNKKMEKVLKTLKRRNYRIVILSNMPHQWGRKFLEEYKMNKYFDNLYFAGELGQKKNNPKLYQLLLKDFSNINLERMFFVNDELEDLAKANNLLLQTIWFENEMKNYPYVPDYVIKNEKELLVILK